MSEHERVSRQDIENKIRVLQNDLSGRAEDKKQTLVIAGAVGATLIVVLAYFFGRRSGRRRGSRVEFRRF